jgi:hypothetical protein
MAQCGDRAWEQEKPEGLTNPNLTWQEWINDANSRVIHKFGDSNIVHETNTLADGKVFASLNWCNGNVNRISRCCAGDNLSEF